MRFGAYYHFVKMNGTLLTFISKVKEDVTKVDHYQFAQIDLEGDFRFRIIFISLNFATH
jgi:hypothetical protein